MDVDLWLRALSRSELDELASVLESGRVGLDPGTAFLQQLGLPAAWAPTLQGLAEQGFTPSSLATTLRWLSEGRRRAERSRPRVVSTQPGVAEPAFMDTAVVLRQLFKQAEREVLLAGFRVTDRALLEHLRRPQAKRLDVRLFVDLHPEIDPQGRHHPGRRPEPAAYPQTWWSELLHDVWPEAMAPPRGWYSPLTLEPGDDGLWRSMHMKTAVVDRRSWLVTSANFTDRGQHRNFELGLLLEDPRSSEAVIAHFESMVGQAIFLPFGDG